MTLYKEHYLNKIMFKSNSHYLYKQYTLISNPISHCFIYRMIHLNLEVNRTLIYCIYQIYEMSSLLHHKVHTLHQIELE